LSDFFFAWIRDDLPSGATWRETSTPYRESLFVQRNTEAQYRQYEAGMVDVFSECRRVLNKDGIMIFTYHHLDPRAWLALSQALTSAGLVVTHTFPLLAEGKSGFHSTEGNIKWDAVFCCRPGDRLEGTSNTGASWVSSWATTVGPKMKQVARGATLGKADKRSLAMALTVARATRQPIPEGDMFLLLRSTANVYATARLKLKPNGHVRAHRTRTAKWFVKEADGQVRPTKRAARKRGTR
jgi:adenine-specific DNA methylase